MNREETLLNSTRKLLGEDMERSDKLNLKVQQSIIEERKEEEFEDQNDGPDS